MNELKYDKSQADENAIVGRINEKNEIEKILSSPDPELFLIYGRRRIGKTFLIHNYCAKKGVYFYFRAEEEDTTRDVLKEFLDEIISVMKFQGVFIKRPRISNWSDAFEFFFENLIQISTVNKIIILFDEFPWFNSKKSKFLSKFSHFWNKRINNPKNNNIKIFCTGSATDFLINKVVKNKKGLFNRLKNSKMKPFTLEETSKFLDSKGVKLGKKEVIQAYLVFGGVPYYLKEIKNDGIDDVINKSFFGENPTFGLEFTDLFEGTFSNHPLHRSIVEFINFSKKGKLRSEINDFLISEHGGSYNGSQRKQALDDLVASDLISEVSLFSLDERSSGINSARYRVEDEFLLFYLYWIKDNPMIKNDGYWSSLKKSRDASSWSGELFERVCLKHIRHIFLKLKIHANIAGYWWKNFDDPNSNEIDILVDRDDDRLTIIEVKFYENVYILDKGKAKQIQDKLDYFNNFKNTCKETTHTKNKKKKNVNVFFITANGILTENDNYKKLIEKNFKLIDLI